MVSESLLKADNKMTTTTLPFKEAFEALDDMQVLYSKKRNAMHPMHIKMRDKVSARITKQQIARLQKRHGEKSPSRHVQVQTQIVLASLLQLQKKQDVDFGYKEAPKPNELEVPEPAKSPGRK